MLLSINNINNKDSYEITLSKKNQYLTSEKCCIGFLLEVEIESVCLFFATLGGGSGKSSEES